MGRRKAGMCKCGHEIRFWHDDNGVCTYGADGIFGAACAREFGGPCSKPRRAKPVKATTRAVTVSEGAVLGALDAVIAATAAQLEAMKRLRGELARKNPAPEVPSILGGETMGARAEKNGAGVERRASQSQNGHAAGGGLGASSPARDGSFGGMSKMRRAILTVLAQHKKPMSRSLVLLHADYRSTGHVSKEFAAMIREELVVDLADGLAITQGGLAALGSFSPLPTGAKLLEQLLAGDKLSTVEKAFLDVLHFANGGLTRGELLERARYSSTGHTSKAFARLVRFGYAHKRGRALELSPELRSP